jgi:hypothetical protein
LKVILGSIGKTIKNGNKKYRAASYAEAEEREILELQQEYQDRLKSSNLLRMYNKGFYMLWGNDFNYYNTVCDSSFYISFWWM